MRDEFSAAIKKKLAERAAYLCSNPDCNRITIGPCLEQPSKSALVGVAAHICAASKGGPRYDMSQTPAQRISIGNGIWLCVNCSVLVDKNNGADFLESHLRKWKRDHETLIFECLSSNKRIIFGFKTSLDEAKIARQLIVFLEQRGALFVPFHLEVAPHVFDSVKEIRTFLTQLQASAEPESWIEQVIASINHACRHFMNTTDINADVIELGYSLGAMRKIVGINLGEIEKRFGLKVNPPLGDAIPR